MIILSILYVWIFRFVLKISENINPMVLRCYLLQNKHKNKLEVRNDDNRPPPERCKKA